MSHNFKPGDLVIIIKALPECAENIGRSVEVVEVDSPAIDDYPIRVGGENLLGLNQFTGAPELTDQCWGSSKCFMPLRGDFTQDQQKAKEAEPCL
ncbi:hypothetical protein [Pseudomonas sp. PAMC 26793]|uniref:hypothetical protein n=1 Tax=Pseudomonas sp. PAMC 26793 TaxID=1240676 RepID=UPI0003717A43|nr:hypothetical protein [Pseudomonas sp. PAMC 26793]